MLNRYAAGVEYLGSAYSGWQALRDNLSLQATLEAALSSIADHPLKVIAAGRTDAGVHAFQQVVHFDTQAVRSDYAWISGTNSRLPSDLSLRWVRAVPAEFHARYSARARSYRYVIHNARSRSALVHQRAAWWPQPLDAVAMHRGGQCLLGEQDFSAFRDSQCQSPTAMRCLQALEILRQGEFVVLNIRANAFLHHMVRNITGTLLEVGLGRQPESWVATVLASRDRRCGGMTAPPEGLYFIGPEYPAEFALPPAPCPWFPG